MTPERWIRVREILDASLAHKPDTRPSFVEEACAGDYELKREIESLIESLEDAGTLLEEPASVPEDVLSESLLDSVAVGRYIGPYRIIEVVGRGGMGAVYRAIRDDGHYRKEVAIKLVRSDRENDFMVQGFRRERQIMAGLDHPNIAGLLDGGSTEDGAPYFVMEYVPGLPIDEYCDSHRLAIAERLHLFRTVCSAVQYAHESGIVHRDIKPGNILITPQRTPKLLDFGIAKLLDPDTSRPSVSGQTQRLMTPEYASPEQIRGEPITPATDVYSLGVLLYELLTGHRPYRVRTGRAPHELAQAICDSNPEKPSSAVSRTIQLRSQEGGDKATLTLETLSDARSTRPHKLRHALAGDLDNIVLMAMRKETARRYPSAAAFAEDIQRHLQGLPVKARPDKLSYRAAKMIVRNRAAVISACAVSTLFLAVSLIFHQLGPTKERDSILLADFANHTGDPVFEFTLRQALTAQLSQSPFLTFVPEERVRETLRIMGRSANDRLVHDVALEVCRRQGVKAMLTGSISGLGRIYVLSLDAVNCQTGEAITRQQAQTASKERVLQAIGKMASRMRGALGESLASIQRFDAPIEQTTTPSLEALRSYALGQRQRAMGNEIQSIGFFQRAIELDPDFASAYNSLSNIYSNLGEAGRAIEFAKLAFERRSRVSERERLYITYQYYDVVTGDLSRAIQTLEIWKQSFPREFQPVNSLTSIHNLLGHYEGATEEGKEAIKRNPAHGFPYSNLAVAYRGLGRFNEARKTAEQAVALRVDTVPTRLLLYQIAVIAGNHKAAARYIDKVKGNPREFDAFGARAQVAAWAGRVSEARQLYDEAVRLAGERNLPEAATAHMARAAGMELAFGNANRARSEALRVLARQPGHEPRTTAALILATTGSTEEAEAFIGELTTAHPDHTIVNAILLPILKAGVELNRNRLEEGIEHLRLAAPYETGLAAGFLPIHLRGRLYLMQGAGQKAAAEYQRILAHRGADPFSPLHAVARLGLARAHALAGNVAGSLQAYEQFLAGWREADLDVPVLLEARDEYRRLKRGIP